MNKFFDSRFWPIHDRLWLPLHKTYQIIEEHSEKAKGNLLDIGGEKNRVFEIFEGKIKNYISLDIKHNQNKSDLNVVGDGLNLPFKTNSIDTVLCTQVLEHIKEPQLFVNETHRVLKKGSYCFLSTNMTWFFHAVPDDYYRFTESGLKYLFKNFSETEVYPAGGYISTLFALTLLPFKYLPKSISFIPVTILNILGKALDKLFFDSRLTTNLVIIAKK